MQNGLFLNHYNNAQNSKAYSPEINQYYNDDIQENPYIPRLFDYNNYLSNSFKRFSNRIPTTGSAILNPQTDCCENWGYQPFVKENYLKKWQEYDDYEDNSRKQNLIELPGNLGTINEKDIDEFVDNLLKKNKQEKEQKQFYGLTNEIKLNDIYSIDGSNKFFALNNPNESNKNFGSNKKTIVFSSKSNDLMNENTTNSSTKDKKELNPNFKFLYQLGNSKNDGLNETQTALYHVDKLKTQEPTVLSLRPSTESLMKLLQGEASNAVHLMEIPFETNLAEMATLTQNNKSLN